MKKNIIYVLIAVMTAALLGLSWLQLMWIKSGIALNEQQFDKNVVAALNEVSNYLREVEWDKSIEYSDNGYLQSFLRNSSTAHHPNGRDSSMLHRGGYPIYTREDLEKIVSASSGCNCDKCVSARIQQYELQRRYFEGLNQLPLAERIDLPLLDTLIKSTLRKYKIDIPFHYGVYSARKNNFILADGGFLIGEPEQIIGPGFENLRQSPYKVPIFERETEAPGELSVFFPNKRKFIWASIWRTLVASVMFMGIIIFSFAYTVITIFRQKKISEMKTDFINNMTHEFKTPIATISLATDSIVNPKVAGKPEKVARFVNIIKQENRRMNEQVEKVLQIAQLDKRDFSLKMAELNLHELIRNAVENISLQVEKRGGKIEMDLRAVRPLIRADATHVANIIHNLLDNANKYSPEKPEIYIATRNRSGGVEIVVKDKGMGMSKEAQRHIFDKFYRIHTGDRHDVKGFGLGLAYVKAIVEAHKGHIRVDSKPGKGSTFTLFLPFNTTESK